MSEKNKWTDVSGWAGTDWEISSVIKIKKPNKQMQKDLEGWNAIWQLAFKQRHNEIVARDEAIAKSRQELMAGQR